MCNADGICKLHLALLCKARSYNVLCNITCRICSGTVNLRRVLAGECTAAVTTYTAVRIDDDLSAGQTAVTYRAADNKTAGRVYIILRILIDELRRNDRLHNIFDHILANLLQRDSLAVLRGNNDGVDALHRVAVVFRRHLRLAVRAEIVKRAVLADFCQLLCKLMRQRDGQRHQLRGLIAGIAEHHALVARANEVVLVSGAVFRLKGFVHAHCNVRGLHVNGGQHRAGRTIEARIRRIVTDLFDDFTRNRIDVHIALGGNLAHHVHHTGRRRHFASYMRGRVFRHDVVENCIGNLVANLVRVAFGHGFRCKKMFVVHVLLLYSFHSQPLQGIFGKKEPLKR